MLYHLGLMIDDLAAPPAPPLSGVPGNFWPAVPRVGDAYVLSLLYQLDSTQWWSAKGILDHQLDQLQSLVAHAHRTVPFYHQRLARIAALPRQALSLERFREVPTLTKDELRESVKTLQSRALPADHGPTYTLFTSGSTGSPVQVTATQVTAAFHAACHLRRLFWHDRDLSAKAANLEALEPGDSMPPLGSRAGGWAPVYETGPLVKLNVRSTLSEQMDWLKRERPKYLLTLPTVLTEILQHCQAQDEKLEFLAGVGTVTEMLPPDIHDFCRRVLGVPLLDTYSANEVGNIAVQCPKHRHYHVQAEDILLEILAEDDEPCEPGEVGRVVVTDLHNFAMPLIRYDIGDFAEVGEACDCGRGLPVLNRIVGRARNMLSLPSGERIWPMVGMAMRRDLPVRRFQMIQRSLDLLEVKIVPSRPLTALDEDGIRESLRHWIGAPLRIEFTYVDEIPRGPGGKYEDFISDLSLPS